MAEDIHLLVKGDDKGKRLDVFLSEGRAPLTRSAIKRLITEGNVLVNGKASKPGEKLKGGEEIAVRLPEPKPSHIKPEAIPIEIVYEDSDLLVVNKRAGMVVHPGAGNFSGTLVNALLHHCGELSSVGGVFRPGIVHRLDKETSGLLMVAKNDAAHHHLSEQLKERKVGKTYMALVKGNVERDEGVVQAPIGRHVRERKKMSVSVRGRDALTTFEVIERLEDYTLIRLSLKTGRTHQIRVHLSHLGHPVAGDTRYGSRVRPAHGRRDIEASLHKAGRIALHAAELAFVHPSTGNIVRFISPFPQELKEIVDRLRMEAEQKDTLHP